MIRSRSVPAGVLLLIALIAPIAAQRCASIPGGIRNNAIQVKIVDADGNPVPDAIITAQGTSNGRVFTAVTDDSGMAVLNYIPAGTYRVEATLDGAAPVVKTVTVMPDQTLPVRFVLGVSVP